MKEKYQRDTDYTIPSDNRELQPVYDINKNGCYYTIPSDNRELQLGIYVLHTQINYTIPSDNRELQPWVDFRAGL